MGISISSTVGMAVFVSFSAVPQAPEKPPGNKDGRLAQPTSF